MLGFKIPSNISYLSTVEHYVQSLNNVYKSVYVRASADHSEVSVTGLPFLENTVLIVKREIV